MAAEVAELTFRAMGSDAHVIVVGGPADSATRARARIDELEQRWSRFIADSEISVLNRSAGEWVEIRARGSYSLAKDRAPVGPAGGGKWKDGNIKEAPFATAEHGAALAVLGFGQRIEKLLVPDCVAISTRYAGPLLGGVNDTGTADNSGQLELTVSRRVPTAAEWLHAGEPARCPAP